GGKTAFSLIMAVLSCMQFPGLSVVCIRETYSELEEAFINNLLRHYPTKIFKYKYQVKSRTAWFANGSRIIFRACDSEKATKKIQGLEYQLMIIDEANNFDEMTLQRLQGSLRNAHVKGFVSTLLMTGNPGGRADMYFRTRFISPDYERWTEGELENKELYKFVKATVYDNPYIEKDYITTLKGLDPALRAAWLDGRWDTFFGQFFMEWNLNAHVIEPFNIPHSWPKAFGLDLGYTVKHPTIGLWAAQDPETLRLYIYREYVGPPTSEGGATEQYALDIKDMSYNDNCDLRFADPSMWNSTSKDRWDDESPAQIFLRTGIHLEPANNDRINGWRMLKAWLHWTKNNPPRLQIFNTCTNLIQTLPSNRYDTGLKKKTEDLDTRGPDDAADALRYLIMNAFGYPTGYEQTVVLNEAKEIIKRAEEVSLERLQQIAKSMEYEEYQGSPLESVKYDYHNDVFESEASYYG
ncbi:MAG TPA: hypothetical protein ENH74_11900, partial [Methylophaga sp.]|nr:hypothetical protein [Methylophaga sp.]